MATPAAPAAQIVVLGSLNMDLVLRVPQAPEAGETLLAHGFMSNPGGKGAQPGRRLCAPGRARAHGRRVGDDAYGTALRDALAADGIDVRHVATSAGSSGLALIMVDDRAQNRIALVAGANASVDAADAEALRAELEASALVLLQLEMPLAAVLRAAEIAAAAGARVVLNPSPAQPLPDALWPLIDLLVLNEIEAAHAGGAAGARRGQRRRRRARAAPARPARRDRHARRCRRGRRRCAGLPPPPALPVTAVDTTAAGDTFIGALCAALVAGEPIDAAVARGIRPQRCA